ncbi:hypothetical protein PEL8287_02234 [Roseovarius litorisediminis]|uniref:Uncharacterized protein n=1 Tax=Roseovarius litorisediminis TaxID=1312363 RepID=A0A1Y5SMG6_9RHOB|nr:hypothetical protein PEL8287_02234 [Roseovarius litorisediminis]
MRLDAALQPRAQGNDANALLSKVGTCAACTAQAVVRHLVQPIRTTNMACEPKKRTPCGGLHVCLGKASETFAEAQMTRTSGSEQ